MGARSLTKWPDLAGRFVDGTHRLGVRVYYEDTDFSGVVYHANYLRFMERGRSDMLRLLGVNHVGLGAGVHGEPLGFVVARIEIDFRKPARIDDILDVVTRPHEVGAARLVLDQEVRCGDDMLAVARVTAVVVDGQGRPRRMPPSMRNRLTGQGAAL